MTHRIDSKHLDAIIIGAGPAGGSAARELAKRGKKVLLIEQSHEIGEPNYSTAGTPKETVEDFDLPSDILSSSWNKIMLATPRTQAVWSFPETMGYVLDFAGLKKFLAKDAAENGAEILVGTSVKEFIDAGEKMIGVRYHGVFGDGEALADVIIDATGHHEFSNTLLKLNRIQSGSLAQAMEYLMTNPRAQLKDTLATFWGSEYAPHGYAWSFPMDNGKEAKVGICQYSYDENKGDLKNSLERFVDSLPYFKEMEPIEIHAGAAHVDGGVACHIFKNVMLIGDAAHQINPLGGEGIRHSLRAGRIAADAIARSLENGVCDQSMLKQTYESEWKKEFGRAWRLSYILSGILYNLEDELLDKLVKVIERILPQDMFEIGFHYDYSRAMKYPGLISLLPSAIKNFLKKWQSF
ncbi:MAG: NAD(P)/FAD-dependent oxidoreductase [Candidatus Sungbacteria bacterium]|nr:NAD(P)/FAD-dependent oxidoreductase [Candidatus Sungbacteria bacterium]